MQTEKICPYPGLRPFNEEESIFFRGREEHIEKIISQLEEKKFLMLTGASGDGKSSIVYAGVIPNARAGFFKAKFNSWQIADFRPERSPLRNMAVAIAAKLGYEDVNYVEKELGFGFSSLVDLYKKSKYYLDQNGSAWNAADDIEKKKLKRKAANLFILVDQFEEFFTNAENYHNGKASVQSQAVLNVLLETARIALAEDLPIYIICTMRSDYIGQCAAFRGLPEYIGFSQFFVPRLKRKEIHQVIEEPATLSGNTISNRLTETLINELGEGFDQLPVLQHALNQVWNQADKGNEEMDLIHLAKLSGLPVNALPVPDKNAFHAWFETVPDFKKKFFDNPSLENVLNAHANELYQTASDYYNNTHPEKISSEDARSIIKAAFQCLTKIDDSRAVRNRMTLEEITNIINREDITIEKVGGTLDIFRLQGNTFLKPFITAGLTTHELQPADVLDITHESLIRNWDLLTEWAKEEYENWINFLDFNKQLERWIGSGKASGYLLPIGPLTFFENWYNSCKPNKYWLARYDESEDEYKVKLEKAELRLKQSAEFIEKSANRLFFSRFVMKHGARKISFWLIYMIFLPVIIHYYWDYRHKQNDWVVENEIEQRGLEMLSSNKVPSYSKAEFLKNYERLEPGSFEDILNSIDDDSAEMVIAADLFADCENLETMRTFKDTVNPLLLPILHFMDKRLTNLVNRQRVSLPEAFRYDLAPMNSFLRRCAYLRSYVDYKDLDEIIARNSYVLEQMLREILEQDPDSVRVNIREYGNSLQLLLVLSPETDFNFFIQKLSPYGSDRKSDAWSREFFEKSVPAQRALAYQWLAYLYSTQKENFDLDKVNSCIALERAANTGGLPVVPEYGVIHTMLRYGTYDPAHADVLLADLSRNSYIDIVGLHNKILSMGYAEHIPWAEMDNNDTYLGSYFLSRDQREFLWKDYQRVLSDVTAAGTYFAYSMVFVQAPTDDNGKGNGAIVSAGLRENALFNAKDNVYYSALYNKRLGFYYHEVFKDAKKGDEHFAKAFQLYASLPEDYKDGIYALGQYNKAVTGQPVAKSFMFMYPTLINEWEEVANQNGGTTAKWDAYKLWENSPAFLNFIRRGKYSEYYSSVKGIDLLKHFCYQCIDPENKNDSLSYLCTQMVSQIYPKYFAAQSLDFTPDFIRLVAINRAFAAGKVDNSTFGAYAGIDFRKLIARGFLEPGKAGEQESFNHKLLFASLAKHLALSNKLDESFVLINALNAPSDRRNLLIDIAYDLQSQGPVENSWVYLDSVFKDNDIDKKPEFGMKLIKVLAMTGSNPGFNLATVLMKDVSELIKPYALRNYIAGIAFNKYYYHALKSIPEYISSNKELQLYNVILNREILDRRNGDDERALEMRKGWRAQDDNEGEGGLDHEGLSGRFKFDSLD
jgi:hypothetical protein